MYAWPEYNAVRSLVHVNELATNHLCQCIERALRENEQWPPYIFRLVLTVRVVFIASILVASGHGNTRYELVFNLYKRSERT